MVWNTDREKPAPRITHLPLSVDTQQVYHEVVVGGGWFRSALDLSVLHA